MTSRPCPIRTPDTADFFDGARKGKLMVQSCKNCGHQYLSGCRYCPRCLGHFEWRPGSGLGRVRSFSVIHHSAHEGFKTELPYTVAEVELQEGPSLRLRVIGQNVSDIRIGQKLKIGFLDDGCDEVTPVWTTLKND